MKPPISFTYPHTQYPSLDHAPSDFRNVESGRLRVWVAFGNWPMANQLFPQDGDIGGGIDTDAHLITFDAQHSDSDGFPAAPC